MIKEIYNKISQLDTFEVKKFFVIFYLVGTAGFLIPYTHQLFTYITPIALLLTFALLMVFHQGKFDRRTIIVFSIIYVIGLLIEIIGVQTGVVFGSYIYSYGLGPKLFGTPLMIGINWLILAYCFAAIADKISMHVVLKIIFAAIAMLFYDIVLEQVADILEMWHWEGAVIPIQNYIAWFAIALFMQIMIFGSRIKIKNELPVVIILSHIGFFVVVKLFYLFVL